MEVLAIKEKKLPALDDDFAKSMSDSADDRGIARESAAGSRSRARTAQVGGDPGCRPGNKMVAAHDFPVPEALVEHQMDARLERAVRTLAAQGVDPRAVNVDWVALRHRQRDRAVEDVKAELLLDRIATAENIEATEEDVERRDRAHRRTKWRIRSSGPRQLDKARSAG